MSKNNGDNMKIGILGGTFDPIHLGHLKMAKCAKDEFNLDKIMLLPNPVPPHKAVSDGAKEEDRLNMVKLAAKDFSYFYVSEYEINKKSVCYSVDTLSHFTKESNEYYFIIGADSFYAIETWHDYRKLISLCTFLVASRDKKCEKLEDDLFKFNKKYGVDFRCIHMEEIDISSTDIRNAVKNHKPLDKLVPESVAKYITENGLYC